MRTAGDDVAAACAFLNRFLTHERGWTSQDVLAAIRRLQALLDGLPNDQTQTTVLRKTAAQFIENARGRLAPTG